MKPLELPKLSAPAHRALAAKGIASLEDAGQYTEAELLKLHGMGPNAMQRLKQALEAQGLRLKASP